MDEMIYGEGLLRAAAASTTYPETPQMRGRVTAAISASPRVDERPAVKPGRWLPSFATFGAAAAGIAIAVGLGVPSSREAIADFFGIEGSSVKVLPTPVAGVRPTPFPTPQNIDPSALPSSLTEAAVIAGFEPALPDGDTPESVYIARYGGSAGVILRFSEFDLWEVQADGAFDGSFGKSVPAGGVITDTTVNGRPARWITGGPHIVRYFDANGVAGESAERTVERSTLIWRTDAALYRLETELPLTDVLSIAETLP